MSNLEQQAIVGTEYLTLEDFQRLLPVAQLLTNYHYHFSGSPEKTIAEIATLGGVNCQYLVHELLGWMFEVDIPPEYLSKEMYEVSQLDPYFDIIDLAKIAEVEPGDVLLFENGLQAHRQDYGAEYLHTALVVGLSADTTEPLCMHILSFQDKTRQPVVIWRLRDFAESKYHRKLVAIRRPRKIKKVKQLE